MRRPQPLDRTAVEALTRKFLEAVRVHYLQRPVSRSSAQEVLNATAIVAAVIIRAARECGDEDGARDFFELALTQQLDLADMPATVGELVRWHP